MIWLIACIASFVLGMLTGQGKMNWVRGAAGKARDAVFGSRPASRANTMQKVHSNPEQGPDEALSGADEGPAEVSPPPANKTIEIGTALKNIAAFLWGLLKNWRLIACIIIAVIVWNTAHSIWRFASCPMGKPGILWCVGQSNDNAALENERVNTRVAELEARVGALSAQLAENSANDRRRVDRIVSEANEDIDHAVQAVDSDELYSVYRRAYDGVWNDLSPSSEPNPAPHGPDRLPGAPANPA